MMGNFSPLTRVQFSELPYTICRMPMKLFLLIYCSFVSVSAWSIPLPHQPVPRLNLAQHIQDAARRAHLDPKLVEAVVHVESASNPKARSHKGAMGLMQVMPPTAEEWGIHQPFHPLDNLMGACQYLRELINRYRGDLKLALAAYNAGPHNVDRYKGIPPFKETRSYVRRVLGRYRKNKAGSLALGNPNNS